MYFLSTELQWLFVKCMTDTENKHKCSAEKSENGDYVPHQRSAV